MILAALGASAAGDERARAPVPTPAEAIAQAPAVARGTVREVPEDGPVRVEVREVYWGEFENEGWLEPNYEVPDDEGPATHEVEFEFREGEQYVLFARRGVGGVYVPFLYWNTRWGVADVVEDELDLSRLAEGPRRIPLAEFRELVRQIKWGM